MSNSHLFWYGILLGLLALFLPPWAKAVVFVVALIASGLFHTLGKAHASGSVPILLVVAIGVVVGLYFGRMRGLSQLGAAESVLRIMRSVMMSVTGQLLSRKRRRSMYLYQAYDFRKWLQDAALEAHLTAGDDEAPI